MISTITAPFVDTSARDLVLSLTEPSLPAVAVRSAELDGALVELRLLTASHQVVVRRDGDELIETLACLPTGAQHLPEQYEAHCAIGDYATTICIQELPSAELAGTVEQLLLQHAADDRYVIGRFPGHPLATTGVGLVDAEPGMIAWRSWHAYPQEQRLVLTSSVLGLSTGTPPSGGVSEVRSRTSRLAPAGVIQ